MATKDSRRPATISLSHANRDALKRITSIIGFLNGKPLTYGQAIAEAERIVRVMFDDPELRQRIAPPPKPGHVCIYESATELVSSGASCDA